MTKTDITNILAAICTVARKQLSPEEQYQLGVDQFDSFVNVSIKEFDIPPVTSETMQQTVAKLLIDLNICVDDSS